MSRLFFALYPDPDTRRAIHALTGAVTGRDGRRVPADNIHLTLAFLGHLEPAAVDCVCAGADRLSGSGFELALDTLGHWQRPQVAWLGASRVPDALRALAAGLAAVQAGCGLAADEREYSPHVTLLRKARRPLPATGLALTVAWRADSFVLMDSVSGAGGVSYTVRREWPLTTA